MGENDVDRDAKRGMEPKLVTGRNKRSRLMNLAHRLFHPGERLSQRVIHAGFWAFALRITDRLFGLARTIVLARVLSPNDFGLFGIALLGLSALDTFSQTGFQQALIQKKGDIKPYLDTSWTVQVIRGFVLAGILFGIAPYVASFFGEPMAAPLLRVLGLSAVLQGLTNIGVIYFQKELEFHKRFIYMFSGTLADLGVAIPAALILRNAWALVFGLLAGNLVPMVTSYFIHPYRPRLRFNKQQFKELFGFGRWVLGSSIVVFLATQGDDIFLGRILGITALGFYQMAFRFANLPGSEIGVLSKIAFPAYSKLQENTVKLRTAYTKMLSFVTSVTTPLAGGIFILGPGFTRIFLGEKWMPMVPALRVLAISAMVREVIGTGGALFYARGRADIAFKQDLVRGITLAVAIYPLTLLWKISGTALAVLLSVCSAIPIWIRGSSSQAGIDTRDYLRALSPPIIGTMAMACVLYLSGMFFDQFQLSGFFMSVAIGVATYAIVIFLSGRAGFPTIFSHMSFLIHTLRKGGETR